MNAQLPGRAHSSPEQGGASPSRWHASTARGNCNTPFAKHAALEATTCQSHSPLHWHSGSVGLRHRLRVGHAANAIATERPGAEVHVVELPAAPFARLEEQHTLPVESCAPPSWFVHAASAPAAWIAAQRIGPALSQRLGAMRCSVRCGLLK